MHIPDKTKVVLVSGCLADGASPFFNGLEDLVLYSTGSQWWPLRKATNELVQKLFCAYLQVEWVAAVLNADVEERDGK